MFVNSVNSMIYASVDSTSNLLMTDSEIDKSDESYTLPNFIISNKLPKNYYTLERTLELYKLGGPKHQLGGLVNVGYNCYVNVVLQCLAYTPGFPQFCLSMPNVIYQNNRSSAFFLDSFARIYSQISANKTISPTWFLTDSGFIGETFKKPIQQDAHEFLLGLIEVMEKECENALNDEDEDSIISHMFSGKLRTEIRCNNCGYETIRIIKFHDLAIPISEFTDLESAIKAITSSEKYIVTSQCEHCHIFGETSKTNIYQVFPLILIVTQLRFDNSCKKIEDFFSFQKQITVSDYIYELYAMILHDGRLISHGHFIAYVKDENNDWFKADDINLYHLREEVVMSSCPYVLFYKRVNCT